MIHVTVWNEFRHEKTNEAVQKCIQKESMVKLPSF